MKVDEGGNGRFRRWLAASVVGLGAAALTGSAGAQTSFATYTDAILLGFVGVVTSVYPDPGAPNEYLDIEFEVLNAARTGVVTTAGGMPVVWRAELQAIPGVSATSLPVGAIISLALYPGRESLPSSTGIPHTLGATQVAERGGALADGIGNGRLSGAIFACPMDRAPPAGAYCDAVAGGERLGDGGNRVGEAVEWAVWATASDAPVIPE
jgi:hypothetical protein